MIEELDTDEGRAWLLEFAAEVASRAFVSGRHMQAAWGREFEGHAVRGMTALKSSGKGGEARRWALEPERRKILAEMARLLQRHPNRSVTWAAETAHSSGLGASPDANRKLWKQHEK